jgi:predicted Zn-dependent peptidase
MILIHKTIYIFLWCDGAGWAERLAGAQGGCYKQAMNHGANQYDHRRLSCGIEVAVEVLPLRKVASLEWRVLSGLVCEPADKLGLAFLTEQTLNKGTAKRSGPELSDAFDALGALHGSWVGRETIGFRCTCLAEYLDSVIDLYAEMLRTPTFPPESCDVALELARQELASLEDDPGELLRKWTARHAYGPVLGRHLFGEHETLARIGRDDIVGFWRRQFDPRLMQIAAAGAIDPDRLAEKLEQAFAGSGEGGKTSEGTAMTFAPGRWHYNKELEQQYISICWPGVPVTDPRYYTERVMIALLGEGMSSRLFTEVREKQGLVYWVGAWHEHPRRGGMIHLGASSTPARCAQTYRTLLREVDRLAEDLTEEELDRAKRLLIVRMETHGDMTRSRASELAGDLFYYGNPVSTESKIAAVRAVTLNDVRRYLHENPRDHPCVVTLGPKALSESAEEVAA